MTPMRDTLTRAFWLAVAFGMVLLVWLLIAWFVALLFQLVQAWLAMPL